MSSNGRKSGEIVIKQEHVDDYYKSRMVGGSNLPLASDGHSRLKETEVRENGALGSVEELQKKIESLNKELLVEKQTRSAAEVALKHLQEVYSKSDAKVQEIAAKLAEAKQKMDQEMKSRKGKNVESGQELNRLQSELNMIREQKKQSALEAQKRANESRVSRFKRQAQPQPRVIPMASSSSSSSDSSSDESENEYGDIESLFANPMASRKSTNMDMDNIDAMMDDWAFNTAMALPILGRYMMELLQKMATHVELAQAEDTSRQPKRKRAPLDRSRSKSPTRKK